MTKATPNSHHSLHPFATPELWSYGPAEAIQQTAATIASRTVGLGRPPSKVAGQPGDPPNPSSHMLASPTRPPSSTTVIEEPAPSGLVPPGRNPVTLSTSRKSGPAARTHRFASSGSAPRYIACTAGIKQERAPPATTFERTGPLESTMLRVGPAARAPPAHRTNLSSAPPRELSASAGLRRTSASKPWHSPPPARMS